MILRRISNTVRNQHWGSLAIELAVVVLGIYLGLQVDSWNETRRDLETETAYLQELAEDFILNLEDLDLQSETLETIIAGMTSLLEQSVLSQPDQSGEELNETFKLILSMPTFFAVDRAWSNLSGSGELRLLRDRNLRNALARYYSQTELINLVQNTHERQLVQVIQPYIIDELDYVAVAQLRVDDVVLPPAQEPERILDVLPTQRFRNVVSLKIEICTDLLAQSRTMKALTHEILTILGADSSAD